MTRRMSVALTLDAVRAETKTVTRRDASTWRDLRPGDELDLIEKGMGLPAGAQQVRVKRVEIVAADVVPLWPITREEIELEGFDPDAWDPLYWAAWWAEQHGLSSKRTADLTPAVFDGIVCRRIEWRYIGRWSPPELVLGFDRRGPAEGMMQRYEEIAA